MVKLFAAVVGETGAFEVNIDEHESVSALKTVIAGLLKYKGRADLLQLFLTKEIKDGPWLLTEEDVKNGMTDTTGMMPLDGARAKLFLKGLSSEDVGKVDDVVEAEGRGPVNVLVAYPDGAGQVDTAAQEDVVWYGMQGSIGRDEGIDLNDKRTLSRGALTASIISRLEETRVVLVKSPPMTGKTSLATLVSRALVNKHREERKKAAVFNLSVLTIAENQTFETIFKERCGVSWVFAKGVLPRKGWMVYMVLDETQVLYKESGSSPRHKSSTLWELVKQVQIDAACPVRILLFAAYASSVQCTGLATPTHFDERMVFGIDELNFNLAEVSEYVQKWFNLITRVEWSASAMEAFCANLVELTGGHVGLCAKAIYKLNEVLDHYCRWGLAVPSPADWIRMLQTGSLKEANDNALFEALTSTRAVNVLTSLTTDELDRLERIAYGANPDSDVGIVGSCLRKGILTRTERCVKFSSPVMWRFFVKMRVGQIVRALEAPNTLPEMILRVMRSIDYACIRQTLGRSFYSGIPLERAWQMEFYKAAYRCTPSTYVTSADVGALFGSRGFLDFTIDGGGVIWGIELLREASSLAEHVERFSPHGSYSSLGLTDFCLVDFRRVASIDEMRTEDIEKDMCTCNKLFVVCYNAQMTGVLMINSAMETVYRMQA